MQDNGKTRDLERTRSTSARYSTCASWRHHAETLCYKPSTAPRSGKNPKIALTVFMRKWLITLNAVVRHQNTCDPEVREFRWICDIVFPPASAAIWISC
jgi:hypothetical protein